MDSLLEDSDMDQLEQWMGTGPKTFTLLYKISRDRCDGTTFHQKCNNKGPTVTVLYNLQQTVYGGYTSQSWTSRGNYFIDDQAFLFRLHYNGNASPVKMQRNGTGHDVYDATNYGPTFGGGHDLHTFTNTVNNSGGYFTLNGYVKTPCSYNANGLSVNDINNGNMNVTDLEVYKVTYGQRTVAESGVNVMWRPIGQLDSEFVESLEVDVVDFKVNKQLKFKRANIILTGPTGVGKSSFCNTLNSIFKGRITQKACSGSAEKSVTSEYTQYTLRSKLGTKLNFRICDTPGLEETDGLDISEFSLLLNGHVCNHYEFNPSKPISHGRAGYVNAPKKKDEVHMVVFVIDASKLDVLESKIVDKIKKFQTIVRHKGVPQVMILTKVDEICQDAISDLSRAFSSSDVEKAVIKAAETFGLPRNSILPLKNYEREMDLRNDINAVALLSLKQILAFTDDYLQNLADDQSVAALMKNRIKAYFVV